ncbi:MAG: ABC transporter permease [Candidatus Aminicenantes bacterium]
MFKNYIKTAVRNMVRHKGFSFINISGLALGLACSLLIILWAMDELSCDRFHQDADRIYHVLAQTDVKNVSTTPTLLAPTLKDEFPEIIEAARFHWMWDGVMFSYGDSSFFEDNLRIVDPSFFKIFNFPFIKGNPDKALADPYSIVITEAMAHKYFAGEDPMGKVLKMNNRHPMTVTGVIKNVPANSTLQFDMLVPMEFRIANSKKWYLAWYNFFTETYIKVRENCTADDINPKIAGVVPAHGGGKNVKLTVLPFTRRYFTLYANILYIYIFSAAAIFLIAIACLNYMNLSTARWVNRAKEIGMRKVSGANRRNIIYQFLGESLLLALLALLLALVLVHLLLPLFNSITGKEMKFDNPLLYWFALGLALVTGIAAGSYPAVFLSRFHPLKVLKGTLKTGPKGSGFRKVLVVFQFSLSILMMIGMFVVYQQLDFIKHKNVGYNKEQIMKIFMRAESQKQYQTLKSKLLPDSGIIGITGTRARMPYFHWQISGFQWEGKDPDESISISYNMVDYDFTNTLQIEMVEGRDFSPEFPTDLNGGLLINEEMKKLMGLESVLGAALVNGNERGKIVGVIKNFHFHSFMDRIEPLVLQLGPEAIKHMLIRVRPENIPATLKFIKETWAELIPAYPFEYQFLDEDFHRRYLNIERTGALLSTFTILAAVIACLGLFGLASFMVEQRTREIGIRKVLGSSAAKVLVLLTGEFFQCVLLANIFAWPLAYIAMNHWLHTFAYRTRIGPGIFIFAGLLAFGCAIFAVVYQALRAARANPVESLRCE